MDSECRSRTCDQSLCGFSDPPDGMVLVAQTTGDCEVAQCDGKGAVKQVVDDNDLPDDGKECTVDACTQGVPSSAPKAVHDPCTQNGGHFCDPLSACVECLLAADCPSGVCDGPTSKCLPASCKDLVKNGTETDVDCGGGACGACGPGKVCAKPSDCASSVCAGMTCQPSCTDGVQNNGESDVDCGGPNCSKCGFGKKCVAIADCNTGNCSSSVCACGGGASLLLSEIKTRGVNGGNDEFVEIYNPTNAAVMLTNLWAIYARTYNGASYVLKWAGTGKTIPAHGHYLTVGVGYMMGTVPDDATLSPIGDSSSVRLTNGGMNMTVDAICFDFDANSLADLKMVGFTCEGTPVSNLPHNDTNVPGSNVDQSLERRPGGSLGNCADTADSSQDWQPLMPPNPQDLASPVTP